MSKTDTEDPLSKVRELDPYEFEKFVAALWELQGWRTKVTQPAGDKGIDVESNHGVINFRVKIQAKRRKEHNRVGIGTLQRYKVGDNEDFHLSVVVTSSSFTDAAQNYAKEANIVLVNGSELAEMIRELNAVELLDDFLRNRDWTLVDVSKFQNTYRISRDFPEYTHSSVRETSDEVSSIETTSQRPPSNSEPEEPIRAIEGIGSEYADQLVTAGFRTVSDVAAADPENVAETTTIREARLRTWINRATYRDEPVTWIDGVGPEYRTQLEGVDIQTVGDLATATPTEISDETTLSEDHANELIRKANHWRGIPAAEIRGIHSKQAEQLSQAGINTIRDLAVADPDELSTAGGLSKKNLKKWIMEAAFREGKENIVKSMVKNENEDPRVLQGIGDNYTAQLRKAGVEKVVELAVADPEAVASKCDLSESHVRDFSQQARYQPRS